MISLVCTIDQYRKPIEYTFGLLVSMLGLADRDRTSAENRLVVSYGTPPVDTGAERQIRIYASRRLWNSETYRKPSSLPTLPFQCYDELPILYVGGEEGSKPFVRRSGSGIETNLDLIASSFFLASCYQEVVEPQYDSHGRFRAAHSLLHRIGLLERPLVNEYASVLGRWIEELGGKVRPTRWWNGHRFCVCLTHDIDYVRKWTLGRLWLEVRNEAGLVRRGRLGEGVIRSLGTLRTLLGDPYWNLDRVAAVDREFGFRSTFFMLADGSYRDQSRRLGLMSPAVLNILDRLISDGFEIGLHGSYVSGEGKGDLLAERRRLEEACGNTVTGIRQHYLRFSPDETPGWQEAAGLLYDTSLGYPDSIGFRSGVAYPYALYDIRRDDKRNLVEIPLVIMDDTLSSYGHLTAEQAWDACQKVLSGLERSGGCAAILWHNSGFDDLWYPGYGDLYQRCLQWIVDHDGWGTTGAEVVKAVKAKG
jgi:peptidoglycan/xylan/chitin deacetylase (PgdA/CDA1 family)